MSKIIIIGLSAIIYIALIFYTPGSSEEVAPASADNGIKKVYTQKIKDLPQPNTLSTTGTVKPYAKVDVISLANGSATQVFFDIGDYVKTKTVLAVLNNKITSLQASNAQKQYSNVNDSYQNTKEIASQSTKQANLALRAGEKSLQSAKLGLENAKKNQETAEIGLKNAQETLDHTLTLQKKNLSDLQNTGIASFPGYLDTVNNALKQINDLIHADTSQNFQNYGLTSPMLGLKNNETINSAKINFWPAQNLYASLKNKEANLDNILELHKDLNQVLAGIGNTADNVIDALDNTPPISQYDQNWITGQRSAISGLRQTIAGLQTQSQSIISGLENLPIVSKQQADALKNALAIARSQAEAAGIGYENAKNAYEAADLNYQNAELAFDTAQKAEKQQILGAKISLDSTGGQFDLASAQNDYLAIKAPISGQIIAKYIEQGAEIYPSQKIAEIAENSNVKIEISLTSEEREQIKVGETVLINNKLTGTIYNIAPTADPITGKINAEIIFDNKNSELIPYSIADVEIKTAGQENIIWVPLDAISIKQTETSVFILKENIAVKKEIKLGKIKGSYAEVAEGLGADDEIIFNGGKNLNDQEKVEQL